MVEAALFELVWSQAVAFPRLAVGAALDEQLAATAG
jgi:hypothetical protein